MAASAGRLRARPRFPLRTGSSAQQHAQGRRHRGSAAIRVPTPLAAIGSRRITRLVRPRADHQPRPLTRPGRPRLTRCSPSGRGPRDSPGGDVSRRPVAEPEVLHRHRIGRRWRAIGDPPSGRHLLYLARNPKTVVHAPVTDVAPAKASRSSQTATVISGWHTYQAVPGSRVRRRPPNDAWAQPRGPARLPPTDQVHRDGIGRRADHCALVVNRVCRICPRQPPAYCCRGRGGAR